MRPLILRLALGSCLVPLGVAGVSVVGVSSAVADEQQLPRDNPLPPPIIRKSGSNHANRDWSGASPGVNSTGVTSTGVTSTGVTSTDNAPPAERSAADAAFSKRDRSNSAGDSDSERDEPVTQLVGDTVTRSVPDDALHLTLEEVLRMGVQKNLSLQSSAYGVPIADRQWIAADAGFDMLLTGSFEVGRNETPATSAFFGTSVVEEDAVRARAGLSRRLRSGGSVSLMYRADRLETNNQFNSINPAWTNGLTYEVTQPLLRGAGVVALNDVRRAQNNIRAAKAIHRQQLERILLAIVETYWELVYAQESLEARVQSEQVARELLTDAQARLDAELGTPLDTAEARAGVEARRSERLAAENIRDGLADRLRALIMPFQGSAEDTVVIIPRERASDRAPQLPASTSADRLVRLAFSARPELREQRAALANTGLDIQRARDAMRPSLNVVGRVGTQGLDTTVGPSLSDAARGKALSASIGVEYSMYVGNRAARANWHISTWRRRQVELGIDELRNQVVVEVRGALRELATARAQRNAAQAEVTAAKEGLTGERARLREGRSTPFRVLQKEDQLTAARTRLARAATTALTAEARVWKATGSLAQSLRIAPDVLPGS